MWTWDAVALVAISVLVGLYLVNRIYCQWVILGIPQERSRNSNEEAIAKIKEVVERAEDKVEIFDDGDELPKSVYDDKEFICLIRKKLKSNTCFTVKCLFNCDYEELSFRKAFLDEPRVDIRTLKPGKSSGSTHYKIIDDGKVVYLSEHEPGSDKRDYRIYFCNDSNSWNQRHFKWRLKNLYRQNEEEFQRVAGRVSETA